MVVAMIGGTLGWNGSIHPIGRAVRDRLRQQRRWRPVCHGGDRRPRCRLQDASSVGGVYNGSNRGVTVVSADLPDFLERLLNVVTGFTSNGDITDL